MDYLECAWFTRSSFASLENENRRRDGEMTSAAELGSPELVLMPLHAKHCSLCQTHESNAPYSSTPYTQLESCISPPVTWTCISHTSRIFQARPLLCPWSRDVMSSTIRLGTVHTRSPATVDHGLLERELQCVIPNTLVSCHCPFRAVAAI